LNSPETRQDKWTEKECKNQKGTEIVCYGKGGRVKKLYSETFVEEQWGWSEEKPVRTGGVGV